MRLVELSNYLTFPQKIFYVKFDLETSKLTIIFQSLQKNVQSLQKNFVKFTKKSVKFTKKIVKFVQIFVNFGKKKV